MHGSSVARFFATTLLLTSSVIGVAEKAYGPGVTDTEIKIGQTMPYSGPASGYSTLGKAEAAYFAKINNEGGINGRKIRFISVDDGFNPAKTVEHTRRLIESEEVLLMFGSCCTAANTAVHKYMNAKKVPQLFIATTALKWDDPQHYPWTMAMLPPPKADAPLYARYLLKHYPNARLAILYQNDDFGKDYLKTWKDALGDKAAKTIVAELSYEVSDPTVDSQIVTLKDSGAEALFTVTTPKAAAQAIRKVSDIGWKPVHFVAYADASIETVLKPAGLDKSVGLISAGFIKDPTDPEWKDDPATKGYLAWMAKYYPDGDPAELFNVAGYAYAYVLVHVLKQCGDDLTRENVMKQAANLRDLEPPMILPGLKLTTTPTDYTPMKQMYLRRFDGKHWAPLSE
jgi:branched-chain amino acid transport system substrate-binding protein